MNLRSIKKQRPQPYPCPYCGKSMYLRSVSKAYASYFCRDCKEEKEIDIKEMFTPNPSGKKDE
jgi:ribosomal protein L37AE/L43A